jgi:hypothetical protein
MSARAGDPATGLRRLDAPEHATGASRTLPLPLAPARRVEETTDHGSAPVAFGESRGVSDCEQAIEPSIPEPVIPAKERAS